MPDNDNNNINFFAETNFRNESRRLGIKTNDRRRHMYLVGKTGMGKTVMLENMAINDIREGKGIGFIDPHGEAAERLLDFIPSDRINDVVYINPPGENCPLYQRAHYRVSETRWRRITRFVSANTIDW